MSAYNLSLFVHITAVVIGLGATFAESVAFPLAMKLDQRHLPYVHRLQRTINKFFAVPALLVILVTGLYQVHKGHWDLGEAWLSLTFAIVVILAALNVVYFIPQDRRLERMVRRELAAGGAETTLSEGLQPAGAQHRDRRRGHGSPAGDRHLPDGGQAGGVGLLGSPGACAGGAERRQ